MSHPSSNTLERVTATLAKLPGVGEKTAMRLALHLLRAPGNLAETLGQGLLELKAKVKLCAACCALTEKENCDYCSHPKRNTEIICVVEDVSDLLAIERSHPLTWTYHVLHGALSPLDGVTPNDLKIRELLERLRTGPAKEIILATNVSVEGEATALYLAKILGTLGVKVTRIAQGIPMGSQLEYVDSATLGRALQYRQEIPHVAHQPL